MLTINAFLIWADKKEFTIYTFTIYYLKMIKLHIENKVYLLPGTMDEMTTNQLISLSRLVATDKPIQEIKVKMLFVCLGAHARPMKDPSFYRIAIGKNVVALTTEEVTQASAAFDYLFTEPDKDGKCFFDNHLTVNHFPEIKVCGRRFYAPKMAMTDLLYNQYIYLQTYDVMKENKPEAIYAWLGCMFRRDKKHFDPEDLNLKHMKRLKPDTIVLMLWFWIGSCRYIADKFWRIFTDDGSSTGGNPYEGQQKLLDYIAKADPEKKRQYKQDELYNILYSLDYMLETEEKNPPAEGD